MKFYNGLLPYIVFALAFLIVLWIIIAKGYKTESNAGLAGYSIPANAVWVAAGDALTPVSGARKALLFGLNYTYSSYALRGCIEDAQNMADLLTERGFSYEMCTDETTEKPTHQVMQRKIAEFLASLRAGDMGVIWYSGHGTMRNGKNALVPLHYESGGLLEEDWMRVQMSAVPAGARLMIGIDACYSGSCFDLKYDIEPRQTRYISPNALIVTNEKTVRRAVFEGTVALRGDYDVYELPYDEMVADVIVISGCRDDQTSADAYEEGEFQGAMTYAFRNALSFGQSLGELQDAMRQILQQEGYAQVPQLSMSRLFSPSTPISCFM